MPDCQAYCATGPAGGPSNPPTRTPERRNGKSYPSSHDEHVLGHPPPRKADYCNRIAAGQRTHRSITEPAVEHDGRAGQVMQVIADQGDDRAPDVAIGVAKAPQRNAVRHSLPARGALVEVSSAPGDQAAGKRGWLGFRTSPTPWPPTWSPRRSPPWPWSRRPGESRPLLQWLI